MQNNLNQTCSPPIDTLCECDERTQALYACLPQTRSVAPYAKLWTPGQTIRCTFLNGTPEQQWMVRIHSMDWPVNLNFEWYETPTGTSSYPVPETEVRISFYDGVDHTSLGSWAYVGKDALKIPAGETTMHFGSLGVYGPDEDKRIIRHEWGHMLGRKHEHYHPDKPWDLTEALYVAAEGWGWSREKTYRVYGLRLEREDHKVGPYDPLSNMHYNMLAEWNTAGLFIGANGDLSEGDLTWADSCYPFEDDGQDDGTAVYLPTVPMG